MLIRRLAVKEQEMQDYIIQINVLKAAQTPTQSQLRNTLIDPAVNIFIQKLKAELQSTRVRLEDTKKELEALKFTPDSTTGKRLMAKCRQLYQENEDLGRMTSNGRLAKLENDLALQRNYSELVKKSQMGELTSHSQCKPK
jgi:pre-mRNA-splicing regulator WTAP